MSNSQFLTMGTHEHHTTEIVVYHEGAELDATDVVKHLQVLKVQKPDVAFSLDNPDMAKFLEDHELIKSNDTSGYLVDHDHADKREQILDIVSNHIDQVIKKCHETYPNGKIVTKE